MQSRDARRVHRGRLIALGVAPLVALAIILVAFLVGGSTILAPLGVANIPVEKIDIERIQLEQGRILAYAVNSGPGEVTIAQVFVNEAMWYAEVTPSSTVPRLGRVTLSIPYNWVEAEPIEISPSEGYCVGLVFKARINQADCAVVLPQVEGYPRNLLEIIAPMNLRKQLRLEDGDEVEVTVRF